MPVKKKRAPAKTASRGGARRGARPAARPGGTIDAYLATLPRSHRAALTRLRADIRAAAPRATETISYRVPTFELGGPLVAFSASARHCAFHVMSPPLVRSLAAHLAPYDVGTATIRFAPDDPLPAGLVKKLVRARIAENERRVKG